MRFSAALAFVQANGSAIEQARLAYLLHDTMPAAEIIGGVFAVQRAGGGWAPFWAPEYSSVDANAIVSLKLNHSG